MRRRRRGLSPISERAGLAAEVVIVCQIRLLVCGGRLFASAAVDLALRASITTGLRSLLQQIRRNYRGRAGKDRKPIGCRSAGRKMTGRVGHEVMVRVSTMSSWDGAALVQVRGLPTLIVVAAGSDKEQRICGDKGLAVHLAFEPYGAG